MSNILLNLKKTAIWQDIKPIIESTGHKNNFKYDAILHTTEEDIPIAKILTIQITCDYVRNTGTKMFIKFSMLSGDYVKRVLPHSDLLELTLNTTSLKPTSSSEDLKDNIKQQRYRAIFLADQNKSSMANDDQDIDIHTLNASGLMTVTLELLDRSHEVLRLISCDGVYDFKSVKTLLHGLLSQKSQKVKIDGKPAINGFDMIDPDNKSSYRNIVVRGQTSLTYLPEYLQHKSIGVYNFSIGNFIQDYKGQKYWFVYPLYNTSLYNHSEFKMSIYSVPEHYYNGTERTYLEDNKIIRIMATGFKRYVNNSELGMLNEGAGARFSDASSYMRKPCTISEEGPIAKRVNLNNEYSIKSRRDSVNFTPVHSQAITSNSYHANSILSSRVIGRLDVTWLNSDPSLLFPAMPAQYHFLNKDKVVTVDAVLLFTETSIKLDGSIIGGNMYSTNTHMVFATKLIEMKDTYIKPTINTTVLGKAKPI